MKGFKKATRSRALDKDIEGILISELEPVSLPEDVQSRMRIKLMTRVRQLSNSSHDFITVRTHEGEWTEVAAGVFHKKLVNDGKLNASMYRMLPGSHFPAHDHPSDEECVCLQGEVNLGGIVIRAGDFHLAPRGLPHGEIRTKDGCLLYIRCAAESAI